MNIIFALLVVAALCGVGQSRWFVNDDELEGTPCSGDGFVPDEDCTKYYICSNGELVLMECAGGTFFNPEVEYCDFPINVKECVGGTRPPPAGTTTSASTNATTATTTTTTTQSPPESTTEATEEPETSTTTQNTTTTSRPEPTTTEAPIESSTPEEISTVGDRNTTTNSPVDSTITSDTTPSSDYSTTPEDRICSDDEDVYTLPVAGNCSLYILCAYGEPIEQVCPQGTYYDTATGTCNKADAVERCSAPICGPNETVLKPIPTDCSKFIICANGSSSERSCPEGTLFDSTLLQCNLAENVDCKPIFYSYQNFYYV